MTPDTDLDRMTPQACPAGVHADWAVDSEYDHACPWCEIARLAASNTEKDETNARLYAANIDLRAEANRLTRQLQEARGIARNADHEWSIRYRDTNGETWVSDLRFTEAGARHEATLEFDSTIEHVGAVYRRLGPWTGADAALPDWLTAEPQPAADPHHTGTTTTESE